MPKKIISEYALSELLEVEGSSLAIANQEGIIIWYNKAFKSEAGLTKLKGRSFFEIFNITNQEDINNLRKNKSLQIPFRSQNKNLNISLLAKKNKLEGYFLKILNIQTRRTLSERHENTVNKNLEFQKEMHDFILKAGNQNSVSILSDEILIRCERLTESKAGIILFYEDNKKYELHYHDVNEQIKATSDVDKEIRASLSFITKWLTVNKKSLVISSEPNSIGFNLANIMHSDYLLISPCFLNDKLVAAIILCKKDKKFSNNEVSYIEQFSALFAIALTAIKNTELSLLLEQKLQQAQKLETVGKLSSGMAHDFNNLLSSIFGSLNLLKKKVPASENITRLVDNIENCAIRARDLTKGLLSFGKPTVKQKDLIKPNALITELSKVVHQTFPKEITFESHVAEKIDDILGNHTEIYQVLLNLCVNAKEAIKGSGIITLAAKNILIDDKNFSDFPWLDKGNYVCFSVSDTGEGISEENIRRIFDPYFSTKKKETGSGLGLYVTNGIVKAHAGYIDVTSSLNKGTRFDVYIPAYQPGAVNTSISKEEKIILLADDEIMLRDLLAELLESSGFNVIKVTSGNEVLKVLTEELKVDLVIIDYNMPGMNGLECVEQIRKLNYKMPVVLSTGSLSVESMPDLEKSGVTALVSKPYEFETMLSTISKFIR